MKYKKLVVGGIILLIIMGIALAVLLVKKPSFLFGGEENITKSYVDPAIYQEFEKGKEWVKVSVNLDSTEETDKLVKLLPPSDFQLKRKMYPGNGFSGNITKKGLDIIIKNLHVKEVYLSQPAHITLSESVPLIGVRDSVWNLGFNGSEQTICILDTGINYSSPYLGGGWGNVVVGGWNYVDNNNNTMDDNGHGTHVAGIIASSFSTYKGVAYGSKLVSVKVCNLQGDCDPDHIEEGLRWCINNHDIYNISVISISIGLQNDYYNSYCNNSQIRDEVENATNHSIPVVISSGNNEQKEGISWPACTKNAIPIGATYDNNLSNQTKTFCVHTNIFGECNDECTDDPAGSDNITCFTNRGNLLSLLAPGCEIMSIRFNNTLFTNYCGTSQAVPHVAGAISLLLQLNPSLTPEQIKDVLNLTGKQIYDEGYSNRTYSRIDVYKAIMAVNASLLRVQNLTEVYSHEKERIFRFEILNANLTNITNISWIADMGEVGNVVNGTIPSLAFEESSLVFFPYTYTAPGTHTVNVSARAGNLLYSQVLTVNIPGGNLSITEIEDAGMNALQKIFRFKVKNFGAATINNINWTFDFGDNSGIMSSAENLNLSAGEEIYIFVRHTYASNGDYTVTANTSGESYADSYSREISVSGTNLEVNNLEVVYQDQRYRIFRFEINNPLAFNLTNVNWSISFGDGNWINSSQNVSLDVSENEYFFAEHEYAGSGSYQVNVTALQEEFIDSQNIFVSVV